MGIERFTRVEYVATNKKGEVHLRPFAAIIYDEKRSTFLQLHYTGNSFPLAELTSSNNSLMSVSYNHGEWKVFKTLTLVELLDHLWDNGHQNLVYFDPKKITPSNLGNWYYGTSLRHFEDGDTVTLDALKIAFNEVLDSSSWARGDSYMHVGGGPGFAGIVYGRDDEDDDAVRLASYINDMNGTDFNLPGFTGVDDIGCCGGTGSMCDYDVDALSHVVLSRTSHDDPWFLTAALVSEEYAQLVKSYREQEGCETKIVRVGEKIGADTQRSVRPPRFKLRVELIPESVQDRHQLEEYLAMQISALLRLGKKQGVDVVVSKSDPIMGQRLLDSDDPFAYMMRVFSAMPYEMLVHLYESSQAKGIMKIANENGSGLLFSSASALMGLMAHEK